MTLLPPNLQRRGLVFSGKWVTVTVTVTDTVTVTVTVTESPKPKSVILSPKCG